MQSRKFLVLSVILAAGVVSLLVGTATLRGDVAPEYKFQFNILGVTNTAPGQKPVVTYSVTNPQTGSVYDLFGDQAFTAPGGLSRLFVQNAWSTAECNNTGSGSQTVPVGPTPASPVAINALSATAGENQTMTQLTHFDKQGASRMVDVSNKEVTDRVAVAHAKIIMKPDLPAYYG